MHWHKRGKTTSGRNRDPALVANDGREKEGRFTMTYIHIVGVRMNPWAWKGCYLRSTVLRFPTCLNTLKSIIYVDDMGFGEPILFQLMEITFVGARFLYNVWKTEVTAFFYFFYKKVFEDRTNALVSPSIPLFILLDFDLCQTITFSLCNFIIKNKIFTRRNGITIRELLGRKKREKKRNAKRDIRIIIPSLSYLFPAIPLVTEIFINPR